MRVHVLALCLILLSLQLHAQGLVFQNKTDGISFADAKPMALEGQPQELLAKRNVSVWTITQNTEQIQIAKEIAITLANDPKLKFPSEYSEHGSGGVEMSGAPHIIILRFGQQRTDFEGKSIPFNFGFKGIWTTVLKNQTEFQKSYLQEYLIPTDANQKMLVEPGRVNQLIVAVNLTPFFSQSLVMKYNPSASKIPAFETLSDHQFITGVRNIAKQLNEFLDDYGSIAIGGASVGISGFNYYVYGADYPTNANFNPNIDVAYDVDLESLQNNYVLTSLLLTKPQMLPEVECKLDKKQNDELQKRWLAKIRESIAKSSINDWGNNLAHRMSCQ